MTGPTTGPWRRVYALRYAYREESVRGEHFFGHDDACHAPMPIDYYVWAVVGDDSVALVDTGFTRETATQRGGRTYLADPAELLAYIGVDAADVGTVVLTHLHYDHSGNVAQFPGAEVILQRRELDFWSSDVAGRGAFAHLLDRDDLAVVHAAHEEGRLRLLDGGDRELLPGLSVHHVGGHTPGMQVVRVETRGGPVVLASDASHFYENIEQDRPYGIVDHLPSMYAAFDRINELAGDGRVVAGHDPLVRERFPAEPGLSGLVHRIDHDPSG